MVGLSTWTLVLLGSIGLAGGVGITTIGPGGVLPTIALFVLTPLSPATVAGTAIVTHIATGIAGSAAYSRSGQLTNPDTRRLALILAGTAAIGTPLGVLINASASKQAFGIILGLFAATVAALLWYRDRHPGEEAFSHTSTATVAAVGLTVGTAAGLVGIGGPMLTVPILLALRVPLLEALAAAQVQSIVIATVGTIGYIAHGSIDWLLAVIVGVPELVGVILGWKIAQAVPTRALKNVLITTLIALSPYLALHAGR